MSDLTHGHFTPWRSTYSFYACFFCCCCLFVFIQFSAFIPLHRCECDYWRVSPDKNAIFAAAAAAAKSLQSRPTLWDPINSSPPGSSVLGIQTRTLKWVAISFSNARMHAKSLRSCLTLRPHGQQPTRLLCPQDSPGKNTLYYCKIANPSLWFEKSFKEFVNSLGLFTVCLLNQIQLQTRLLVLPLSHTGIHSMCLSKVKVKVTQPCLTLCNPMDYTVRGILQARILEWVVFPFSGGSSQPRDWTQVSRIVGRFFTSSATRGAQEHWSR